MSVRVFLLPFALYPEIAGVAIETGNDMTDIHGLISHQTGYYYITLEEDYVLMFQLSADRWFERSAKTEDDKKAHAARRAHAVAKAYISSVLEQLSDKHFKHGISESKIWVFLSFPEIERRIHGGVKLRTLKDAMKEMVDDGYAAKRANPNPQFRSKIYHMNFKRYRNELNALPKRTEIDDRANLHDGLADSAYDADMHDDSANLHDDNADMHEHDADMHDGSGKFAPKNNYRITIEETQNNLEEGTFVASATPTLSQDALSFDEDDPEKTVERLPAVHSETASHRVTDNDYTNEGGEHARHDYCSEQRPGVSVFLPALAGSDVPPDLHDTPDADQGHPGLSAGLHAISSRDRTDAQTPGDQAVTPSQHTTPDVLAGAASGEEQALDAAATAPPPRGSEPPASGDHGADVGKQRGKNGKARDEPIPDEALAILDAWDSLFKHPVARTEKHVQAALDLVPCHPSREDLQACKAWLFTTDNPQKPWFRKIGVKLADVANNYDAWQSVQPDEDEEPEMYSFAWLARMQPDAVFGPLQA